MAKNRAKNREKTGSCRTNPNKQSTQVYKTPKFLNQAESGVSGSVEVAHGTRSLSINASVSDKGAHGGKVSQYSKNAYAPKRRANKKNRGEADAPYAYEEEDTPNVDFTADRETIEKYCAKFNRVPIALILPKSEREKARKFSGGLYPNIDHFNGLEGWPTAAVQDRIQKHLEKECLREQFGDPDYLALINVTRDRLRDFLDDPSFLYRYNYLSDNGISHRMFMISDYNISAVTMEQIVHKTAAERKKAVEQELDAMANPLREETLTMKRLLEHKKNPKAAESAKSGFLHFHDVAHNRLLDYFAFAALSQARITGTVATFSGIKDPLWKHAAMLDGQISLDLALDISIQEVIERLEQILDGYEFLSPENEIFYMERIPVRNSGFCLLRVFYENIPNAKDYFAAHYLQPEDRIRDWLEHRGEYNNLMYASAMVDLCSEKLPMKLPTQADIEARARRRELKERLFPYYENYQKKEARINPNLEPKRENFFDGMIEVLDTILQTTEYQDNGEWRVAPESIEDQPSGAALRMEVCVDYYASHCPNCRNLGHTIKNCSRKK